MVYTNTDAVLFTSPPGEENPTLRTILGEFSNALGGGYSLELLSVWEETYCQQMMDGEQRIRCYGIPKTE